MAMVDMKDLLYHAYNNRYAVGAFEIVSLDFLEAVIQAAEKSRSPAILNLVSVHFDLFDVELMMAAAVHAAKRSSAPIAIHFDHCKSTDTVHNAIRLGCNGIMYDASDKPFPVNVEKTSRIVEIAHSCGIPVEGELGHVAGVEHDDEQSDEDASILTSVNETTAYIERTGIDFLAISIGTVHGRAKTKPRLDFNRLMRINESIKIPLVIHGGTGLTDAQYHKLIDHGVAKINYFTALAENAFEKIKSNLQQAETYSKLFNKLTPSLTAEVQRFMQTLGSAGRAAEVLVQCRPWQNVEHVIVYNANTDDPSTISEMLIKGKKDLSGIPGVIDVQIGKSVDAQAQYRYCWLIRFSHQEVIENYKFHPVHQHYADHYFRPIAGNRITTDYNIIDNLEYLRHPDYFEEVDN